MHDLDAAYVFGNMGNLSSALGRGWSVEDAFAWAVGQESELTLNLPDGESGYILRLDIHPVLFPPAVIHQRLTIMAGDTELGSYVITGRRTIAVSLPPAITRGARHLRLKFHHPDATRPSNHRKSGDSRLLALCFHSASFVRERPLAEDSANTKAFGLEPVHGLIAGDTLAFQLCSAISRLPSLKGRLGLHFVNLGQPLTASTAALPPAALETACICWTETNAGSPATRDALRDRLSPDCAMRGFYLPTSQALWPFQGRDNRAEPEPGRYWPSRYPNGDQVAQGLADTTASDDELCRMYEAAAEQEPLDLDAVFKSDLRRWRNGDAKSDIRLAEFIARHFTSDRVFLAPKRVGPVLLKEMIRQILDEPIIQAIAGANVLTAELEALMDGFAGSAEEVPVHGLVAEHFGLSWWSADLRYRWMNNLRTHREYILDYINWAAWRP